MLRYKTENRPGLVALYDIRPGNGAGSFLQPRSPHGAPVAVCGRHEYSQCMRQTDVSQTSDAHHRLMPPPDRGGGIINEQIQLSALPTTFKTRPN